MPLHVHARPRMLGSVPASLACALLLLTSCAHRQIGGELEIEATRAALRVQLAEPDVEPPQALVVEAEDAPADDELTDTPADDELADSPADDELADTPADDALADSPADDALADPATGDESGADDALADAPADDEAAAAAADPPADDTPDAEESVDAPADEIAEESPPEETPADVYPEPLPTWGASSTSVHALRAELGDGSSSERMIASLDRLARALDEKRWQEWVEARLDDKQRQIDMLRGAPAAGSLTDVPATGGTSARAGEVDEVLDQVSERAAAAGQAADLATEQATSARSLAEAAVAGQRDLAAALDERLSRIEQAIVDQAAEAAEAAAAAEAAEAEARSVPPAADTAGAAAEATPAAAATEDVDPKDQRLAAIETSLARLLRETEYERERADAMLGVREERARLDAERAELEARRRASDSLGIQAADTARDLEQHRRRIEEQRAELERERAELEARRRTGADDARLGALEAELVRLRAEADAAAARVPSPVAPADDGDLDDLEQALEASEDRLAARMNALESRVLDAGQDEDRIRELEAALADYEDDRALIDIMSEDLVELRAEKERIDEELQQADAGRRRELEARQLEHERRTGELLAEIERLQANEQALETRYVRPREELLAQLQPLADAGLRVDVTGDRIRVRLPSDVLFGSGSSTLNAAGRAAVVEVGEVLRSVPALRVQVEGHTDNVPVRQGRYRSNWDLAYQRASSVLEALIAAEFPARRISAASYGETRPAMSNETADGRRANRRIELLLQLDPAEEQQR